MNHTSPSIRRLFVPDTLTTKQIAATLHVSSHTVSGYIGKGWLRATRVGRQWLVRRAELDRLLDEGTPRG